MAAKQHSVVLAPSFWEMNQSGGLRGQQWVQELVMKELSTGESILEGVIGMEELLVDGGNGFSRLS